MEESVRWLYLRARTPSSAGVRRGAGELPRPGRDRRQLCRRLNMMARATTTAASSGRRWSASRRRSPSTPLRRRPAQPDGGLLRDRRVRRAQRVYEQAGALGPGPGDAASRTRSCAARSPTCTPSWATSTTGSALPGRGRGIRQGAVAASGVPRHPHPAGPDPVRLRPEGRGHLRTVVGQVEPAGLPDRRILLGVFLFSSGRKKEAVDEWQEILVQDPDNQKAKMYLRLAAKTQRW